MKETNIKVTMIEATGMHSADPNWFAARLLAFTKNTRLNMSPEGFQKFLDMPLDQLKDELGYIVNTLPSSWEFVDATFMIEEVSRACAQQITRTRWSPMEADLFGSYAMQAQRVTDVTESPLYVPDSVKGTDMEEEYKLILNRAMAGYSTLLAGEVHNEDARGVLPQHMSCNLVVKLNLRVMSELLIKRSSMRVQGEYNEVVRQMREQVLALWPWAEPFFDPKETLASRIIEEVAAELPREQRLKLAKAADLIKLG